MLKKCFVALLLTAVSSVFGQTFLANDNAFVGRVSLGWNYYSEGGTLSPQLNSVSNYATLNYRAFGDSQSIRYQFRGDFYEKDAFSSTHTLNRNDQLDHRYIVRQLYGSYSILHGEIKLGRTVPLNTHVDVYPINGGVLENLVILDRWHVSAFGGKIHDEYANRIEGLGYDAGGSLWYEAKEWMTGTGVTSEQLRETKLSKVYLFGEFRPSAQFRLSSSNQYVINRSFFGYSQNTFYLRVDKRLSLRAFAEYQDRRAYAPARTDSLGWDRYFFASRETVLGGSLRYQVFQITRVGSLDVVPLFKKRIGNGDLTYGSLQFNYHNYFWARFNAGLAGSYTSNQWLDNFKLSAYWNKDYLDGRFDCTLGAAVNVYKWNTQTSSSNKSVSTVSLDINYRFTRTWDVSVGMYEEFGNATEAHSGFNIRMNYYLR